MNFVIPVRPAVLENESRIAVFIPQNLFGDKIQLPTSKEARTIQPSVDIRQMPLKPEYQNKENNPLWAELKNEQQLTDEMIVNHPVSSPSINPQEIAKQRFETVDLETLLAKRHKVL